MMPPFRARPVRASRGLRKVLGTSKLMIRGPLFDLKHLRRFRREPARAFRSAALALLAGVLVAGGSAAEAHPHVWVTATSELVYSADGQLTGVRYAWTFDDMFSSYALQGLTTKTKGVYTREDLQPLAQANVAALKEFDYFTSAEADGKTQQFAPPVDYFMDTKDDIITLHFTLPVKTPFKSRQLSLEVYDPTYFVDFRLADDKDTVQLSGAPAACQVKVQLPNDGTADAQTPGEQSVARGNADFDTMFVNKITVECP
jgi:ABC-type uncharacterized transport system substrate-binding protein